MARPLFSCENGRDRRPERNEWIKHSEMFESLTTQIDATHLTGLQRVKGLWRIYLDNLEDKICLLANGVTLRGKVVPLLSTNPGRLDGENTLRIRVQDVPLSADDGIISRTLILSELEVISMMREKLRINGKLVNCETGDRIVTIKASSLKEPLPRFMAFAQFTGKIFHPGQNPKKELKCSKCLEEGHSFKFCVNDWKCTKCFKSGHKQDVCDEDTPPEGAPLSLHIPARAENVDTTPYQSPYQSADNEMPEQSRDPADETRKQRRKKTKRSNKSSSQQSISHYMSSSQTKDQTPNNRKQNAVSRSPPTPAEIMNSESKKSCHTPKIDDTRL